jgi:hypothetical protein
MGRQASPDKIRQFQQDAELLISNKWNVTMIAEKMEVNPSNLSGNINFREATDQNKTVGKKPGSDTINKFYLHFRLEVERLKPAPDLLSREGKPEPEFNQDERQRRIRELEENKKFLEQQLAAVIINNTTLSNSIDSLADNYTDLAKNNADLSKAYVELALRGKPDDGGNYMG